MQLFVYSYQKELTAQTSDYKITRYTEASVLWDIYVMEIDLTKDGIQLKTGLANDLISYMNPDDMVYVQEDTLEGNQVIEIVAQPFF